MLEDGGRFECVWELDRGVPLGELGADELPFADQFLREARVDAPALGVLLVVATAKSEGPLDSLPVELARDRDAGNSPGEELEEHAATAGIEIRQVHHLVAGP